MSKRLFCHLVMAVTLAGSIAGCGFYTNLPAQVFVATVKPGNVIFEPPDTRGIRAVKITNPEVMLRGELGSIGATFNAMNAKYYLSSGSPANAADLPSLNMGLTFRVDSSNLPADVNTAEAVVQAEIGQRITPGRTTFELPVITRHVEQFGLKSGSTGDGNAAAVYASVSLKGFDDANFAIQVDVFAPITFNGVLAQ